MNSVLKVVLGVILCLLVVEWVSAEFCPGHKIRCRKTQTCCADKKGSYGCCPYPNATCCKDGLHCCPHNTVCDVEHQRCKQKPPPIIRPMVKTHAHHHHRLFPEITRNDLLSILSNIEGGRKVCPDGVQKCPMDYTCCEQTNGSFSCCPFKNGICCSDKVHCCPSSNKCNVERGSCDSM